LRVVGRNLGAHFAEQVELRGPREQRERAAEELDAQRDFARPAQEQIRRHAIEAGAGVAEHDRARKPIADDDQSERDVSACKRGAAAFAGLERAREIDERGERDERDRTLLGEQRERKAQRRSERNSARPALAPVEEGEQGTELREPGERIVEC
jgi:hypothetical protein